tara:strand:+ start:4022 stop:4273 length:252 start_codon:yes stop_codon:yes gene_type:complete
MTSNNNEELKIVCMKLIEEATFKQIYDKENDVTTFEIIFPKWLKETYEPETVKSLVELITPILQDEMNKMLSNKHIGTIIEGI